MFHPESPRYFFDAVEVVVKIRQMREFQYICIGFFLNFRSIVTTPWFSLRIVLNQIKVERRAEKLKIMDDKSWIPNGAYFGGKNPLKHFWLGDLLVS